MALKIGFANVFYTLWDVRHETVYTTDSYGNHHATGTNTIYSYMGRLSTDMEKAIEKAQSRGCSSLVPDMDLKGKSSWEKFTPIEAGDGCFKYGWNKGQLIAECNDLKTLVSYGQAHPHDVIDRIRELSDEYIIHDERVRKSSDVDKENARAELWTRINSGQVRLVACSNFSLHEDEFLLKAIIHDPDDDAEWELNKLCPYGFQLFFNQEQSSGLDLQRKYYNGYTYYTPSGARSFKGKTFVVKDGKIIL
jgi:hypothetical protein